MMSNDNNETKDTKTEDLTFLGTDPGAVKFGNFINYYSFHDVQERTSKLDPLMFPKHYSDGIICLDVGCNTGNLTNALYQYLKTIYLHTNIHVLGIDIDPTLIQRAQESNDNPNITFVTANIMEENYKVKEYMMLHKREKFDITFCFSVTMWIHLNNGDEGLMEFLKYIKSISRAIIIEPQPWKCYRIAQKRLKKAGSTFHHYKELKIRSNVDSVIGNKLLEENFSKIYESELSSWNRKIYSYHNKN